MKFLQFGEQALLVNFEQKIDEAINAKVHTLNQQVLNCDGVTSTVPAYCSLTVIFDRSITNFKKLTQQIESFDLKINTFKERRSLILPVCYAEKYGLDLLELETQLNLKKDKIIELHQAEEYKVYMMGFLPGFGYLGKLPDALNCKRKLNPRKEVPAMSVGIAGQQTGIYPISAPGGWQIIGKTPIPLINRDYDQSFLLRAGDSVKFQEISQEEFDELSYQIKSNTFNIDQLYG